MLHAHNYIPIIKMNSPSGARREGGDFRQKNRSLAAIFYLHSPHRRRRKKGRAPAPSQKQLVKMTCTFLGAATTLTLVLVRIKS